MSEALETVVESVYSEENPCASGACSMPESTVESEVEEILITKSDLVIFNLRGKVRSGKVISKGNKFLRINTIGLQTNTKISVETEFVPVTVFVEKAVLNELEKETA